MLALIAATSLETRTLRAQLGETTPLPGGFPLFLGKVGTEQVLLAHSGVGKVNAAACAAGLLGSYNPEALINIGCGGAYPHTGLNIGDLAMASSELMLEEGSNSPNGFLDLEQLGLPLVRRRQGDLYNLLPTSTVATDRIEALLRPWAAEKKLGLKCGLFITVSTCTGTREEGEQRETTHGAICESMEGAAVALVAARFNCPLVELRGISNLASRRDTSQWDIPTACKNVEDALLFLLQNWPRS